MTTSSHQKIYQRLAQACAHQSLHVSQGMQAALFHVALRNNQIEHQVIERQLHATSATDTQQPWPVYTLRIDGQEFGLDGSVGWESSVASAQKLSPAHRQVGAPELVSVERLLERHGHQDTMPLLDGTRRCVAFVAACKHEEQAPSLAGQPSLLSL